MRFLLLSLGLLLTTSSQLLAQVKVEFDITTSNYSTGKQESGVTIKVYKGGALTQTLTTNGSGKIKFVVDGGDKYKIEFSKAGKVTRFATVDLSNVMDELIQGDPPKCKAGCQMIDEIEGMDYSYVTSNKFTEWYYDPAFQFLMNDEVVAERMRGKIEKLMKDAQAKGQADAAFNAAVQKADDLYTQKKWNEALKAYEEAGKMKAGDKHCTERMLEIDGIIKSESAANAEAAKKEQDYQALITSANTLRDQKKYAEASKRYDEAYAVKNEQYAKDESKKALDALAKLKADEENAGKYNEAVKVGDELFKSKKFAEAIPKYEEALKWRQADIYATGRITEIKKKIQEEQAAKEKKDKYDQAVSNGDNMMSAQEWESARAEYNVALTADPTAAYPKEKIKEAEAKITEAKKAKELQDKVDKLLAEGNTAFTASQWPAAKTKYQEVIKLQSTNEKAIERLAAIDTKIAEEKANLETAAKVKALIAEAEVLVKSAKLAEGKDKYQAAYDLKADAAVKAKIDDLTTQIAANAKKAEQKQAYDKAMAEGEIAFSAAKYDEAIGKFTEAKGIDPAQTVPPARIAEAGKKKAEAAAAAQKAEIKAKYDAAMAAGETGFSAANWDEAIAKFKEAGTIDPTQITYKPRLAEAEKKKAAAEKAEADRLAAEKAAKEKAEADRLAAEKAAKEKAEAERLAAEKAAKEKAEADRLAAEKAAKEKAEADRLAAEKAAKEKAEADRLAAEKAAKDKAEAERLAAEKAAAEKAEAARLAAEKAAAEKAEAERLAAEKAAAQKAETERLAAEKLAKEKAEAERLAAEKAAREKAEADRLAAEKAAKEKAEADRIAAEKAAKEKAAADKAEAERLAAEKAARDKAEAERLAAEKANAEKSEAERLAAEKAAREKAEADRIAAEKAAKEKAEADRLAAEKAAKEKAEADRLAAQQSEAQRLAAEKAAKEKAEADRLAAEKAAKEKEEADRLAAQQSEAERLAAEKAAKEKAAADKLEAERLAAEKAARDKAEADRLAAERAAGAKSKEAEDAAYAKILEAGQKAMKDKNYTAAKESYTQAAGMRPSDPLPPEKLKEIADIERNAADSRSKEADEAYNKILAVAQKAFEEKNYSKAKENYAKAMDTRPSDPYPKQRLKEIEELEKNELDAKGKLAAYTKKMEAAEVAVKADKFEDAIFLFGEAQTIKPDETRPAERIAELKVAMGKKNNANEELEKRYQEAMAQAGSAEGGKDYKLALTKYQDALNIKKNDKPAQDKVAEMRQILDELANKSKGNPEVDKLVAAADKLYSARNWIEAKKMYEKALAIDSSNAHCISRVGSCDQELKRELDVEKRQQYDKIIAKADGYFNTKDYSKAREYYERALSLVPTDPYPKQKLTEIDRILNKKAEPVAAVKPVVPPGTPEPLDALGKLVDESDVSRLQADQAVRVGKKESYLTAVDNNTQEQKAELADEQDKTTKAAAKEFETIQKTESEEAAAEEKSLTKSVQTIEEADTKRKNDDITAGHFEDAEHQAAKEQLVVTTAKVEEASVAMDGGAVRNNDTLVQTENKYVNSEVKYSEDAYQKRLENDGKYGDIAVKHEEIALDDTKSRLVMEDVTREAVQTNDKIIEGIEKDEHKDLREVEAYVNKSNETVTTTAYDHSKRPHELKQEMIPVEETVINAVEILDTMHLAHSLDAQGKLSEVDEQLEETAETGEKRRQENLDNLITKEDKLEELNRQDYNELVLKTLDSKKSLADEVVKQDPYAELPLVAEQEHTKQITEIKDHNQESGFQTQNEQTEKHEAAQADLNSTRTTVEIDAVIGGEQAIDNEEVLKETGKALNSSNQEQNQAHEDKSQEARQLIAKIEKRELVFDDKAANELGRLYPEGVSEEKFEQKDDQDLLTAIITRRIVVKNGYGAIYVKTQTLSGVTYSKNGQGATEAVWQRETNDASLKHN